MSVNFSNRVHELFVQTSDMARKIKVDYLIQFVESEARLGVMSTKLKDMFIKNINIYAAEPTDSNRLSLEAFVDFFNFDRLSG